MTLIYAENVFKYGSHLLYWIYCDIIILYLCYIFVHNLKSLGLILSDIFGLYISACWLEICFLGQILRFWG